MTEKYPLLTTESVKHWYLECDPAYSVIDIAKVTGASQATIYRFMERNRIPRRSRSEASINRFKCEHKKEEFVKQRNTSEFKKNQSQYAIGYWLDQSKRRKMMNGFSNYIESVVGLFQAQILYLLKNSEGMFLSNLTKIIKKDKTILDQSLRALHKRGLIARRKEINHNTRNSNASQYYYSITNEGVVLLAEKEKTLEFNSLLKPLETFKAKSNPTLEENTISVYLGINQKVVLRLFQEKSSLFLTDLKKLTSLDRKTLDNSLRGLVSRGILSRKKESNPNSGNHLKHYKYRLTELGRKIVIE